MLRRMPLEFSTAQAQKGAAADAAASSAAEGVQAAAEVEEALENAMAASARSIGFTNGLKGNVTVSRRWRPILHSCRVKICRHRRWSNPRRFFLLYNQRC